MNLLFSFTDEWLSLPVWAWIVIAAGVLILIIVIIAVAARSADAHLAAPAQCGIDSLLACVSRLPLADDGDIEEELTESGVPKGVALVASRLAGGNYALATAYSEEEGLEEDYSAVFSLLANVADVKSLVIHPASTTHSQESEEELAAQGIGPGTIRLSIGLEHIDDILADLERGFAAVRDLR